MFSREAKACQTISYPALVTPFSGAANPDKVMPPPPRFYV